MIFKLVPFLILGFLAYLAYRYYRSLSPEQRKPFIIKYAVYGVIALLLLAVVTGRIHWLGAVLAGAIGLLKVGAATFFRFLPFLRFFQKNRVFGDPKFKTQHLEVVYNMQTGAIAGKVIAGEFAGRDITSLDENEIDKLEQSLKETDTRSYYLLRVIRQRREGTQQSENTFNAAQVGDPSIEEAEQILGLDQGYSKKDIDLSYKRLMHKLHPDRGGNNYLASRVNTARDILLKHLDKK